MEQTASFRRRRLPTMVRFRNRYLLCTVEFELGGDRAVAQVTARTLYAAVRSSVEINFGDVGAGNAIPVLSMKLWSPPLALAIIRASRDHYTTVWAAITMINALPQTNPDNPVRISVIHVGATIRACQKAAADHAGRLIVENRKLQLPVERLESAYRSAEQELLEMEPA
jgi:ribonuclease P/MRP protein subunit POP5